MFEIVQAMDRRRSAAARLQRSVTIFFSHSIIETHARAVAICLFAECRELADGANFRMRSAYLRHNCIEKIFFRRRRSVVR